VRTGPTADRAYPRVARSRAESSPYYDDKPGKIFREKSATPLVAATRDAAGATGLRGQQGPPSV
jgi:hypothetical protein